MSQKNSSPGIFNIKKRLQLRKQVRCVSNSKLFDRKWYLEQYPDVAKVKCSAAKHYVLFGAAEGRNPGPFFDTREYLQRYPDIAQSGMNPLYHYIRWGGDEGRLIDRVRSGIESRTNKKPGNKRTEPASYPQTSPAGGAEFAALLARCQQLESENKKLSDQLFKLHEALEEKMMNHAFSPPDNQSVDALKEKLSEQDEQVAELKSQLLQLNQFQDEQAQKKEELQGLVLQLTDERDTLNEKANELSAQFDLVAQELASNKDLLHEQQRQTQHWQKKYEGLEAKMSEKNHRQRLMDEELVKAEAQIDLITDVLIRDKAF